jgi:hypothetical protein
LHGVSPSGVRHRKKVTGRSGGFSVEQLINLDSENVYEITVRGEIDVSWLTGFGEVDIRSELIASGGHPSTLFTIITDQAGLVGLVRRLHGLGVVLVSVRQAPKAGYSIQT